LISWYFDLVSPFAYLALPAVERLAARHPVHFRPVVLGAILQHWGGLGPAEVPPKRRHTYRLCQFLADQARMPFRFPPAHPFRSLDALRGLASADGSDPAAVRAAFDHVWARGGDPAALPGSNDPAAKERLRAWTAEAVAAGVFGVPSLVIAGEVFWGLDAMPMAEAFLRDPALFRAGEMARLDALPVGVQRRTEP
jgi:2-hydroxychromene-2-carboxylate isomerase